MSLSSNKQAKGVLSQTQLKIFWFENQQVTQDPRLRKPGFDNVRYNGIITHLFSLDVSFVATYFFLSLNYPMSILCNYSCIHPFHCLDAPNQNFWLCLRMANKRQTITVPYNNWPLPFEPESLATAVRLQLSPHLQLTQSQQSRILQQINVKNILYLNGFQRKYPKWNTGLPAFLPYLTK